MPIKLDVKDKKILHQLDINCRQSNSQIGRKVGLSKGVVNYRIKELERKGLIQSYYTIVNIAKLGYTYTRFYFNFHSLTKEKYNEIILFFKKIPNLNWLGDGEGEWEFAAVFLTRNVLEINEIYEKIIERYSEYIVDKEISPATRVTLFYQRYAYINNDTTPTILAGSDKSDMLSEKDMLIIKTLQENTKIRIQEISKRVGLTPKMVTAKINKLVKNKFILGFRFQLNHILLGFDYYHIYFRLQNINDKIKKSFIELLTSIKNVFYITESYGKYDVECEFIVKSQNELYDIINDIKYKLPGLIRTYKSALIYKVYRAF